MKAVAKTKAAPGFEWIDAPMPEVTSHRVLVRVKAASVCGSDVHLYKWDPWARENLAPPKIIGHECAGEVVEVGDQVEHICVGDHVALESHIPCQGCTRCRSGEMHLCNQLKTIGFGLDGCFAEYIAMPEICCIKINSDVPWEIGSIHEPLGNSVYTVAESDVAGKTVVIFGDGPTGLFAAAVARAYGAAKIFAVGASPVRLEIMKKLGPDFVLNAAKESVVEFIQDQTKGEGVDGVIEMSGAPAAIHDGFKILRNGGTFTAFGIPSKPLEIDFAKEVILKGIKVVAIHGRKMFDTWTRMAALFRTGRFDVSPVITHRMPLAKFDEAMKLLTAENIAAGKIVFIP